MNVDYLRECFDFDSESGALTWKERPLHHFKNSHGMNIWNARYAGKIAGTKYRPVSGCDYERVKITINCKPYMAHKIMWMLCNGDISDGLFIDHIDGDATNNSISNLRMVTHSQNHRNRKRSKNSKSPHPGVRKFHNGKWQARIKINGKEIHLGYFEELSDAINKRKEYERSNGFTERHGS